MLWVRVHTDAGPIGLGETFYGAGAVESHLHATLAGRLLGKNPLHIEALHRKMLNLPMAQSSTGVEYRAASAVDIALWDVFGKVCGQPVHQMLGVENGFVLPMEGPGLGTELQPAVFERSDLTVRRSEA